MAKLVLVRHGLSEYNKTGQWTGWVDPDLAPEGLEQARVAGQDLKDIQFDIAYSNILRRCKQTLEEIKKQIGKENLKTVLSWEINERNYGEFTLKNKWEVKEQVGDEVFQQIRRSWDYPIKAGESLKQVYERSIPYYEKEIVPKLNEGKNVLIVSSNNALRSLIKYIENIADDDIANHEIGTGEVYVYDIDESGKMTNKEVRAANPNKGKV